MRKTIVRIGAAGAGVLMGLGLLVASPAGASGSEREKESERSKTIACFDTSGKTQGRSQSDPDGMSNGGPDKPGCTGGFDVDRDGNNGCGNDADREDDNNGRCKGKQAGEKAKTARDKTTAKAELKTKTKPSSSTTSTTTTSTTAPTNIAAAGLADPTGVLAPSAGIESAGTQSAGTQSAGTQSAGTQSAGVEADAAGSDPQTEVLGETLERPSVLARTGAGIGGLTLLGGLLCGGGRLAVLARRFLRID